MQEEYLKDYKIIERNDKDKELELIKTIIQVREELNSANKNFEYAEDDLIDYYTYQIKANQSKLNYLLKIAKVKGLTLDRINEIRIRMNEENNKAV